MPVPQTRSARPGRRRTLSGQPTREQPRPTLPGATLPRPAQTLRGGRPAGLRRSRSRLHPHSPRRRGAWSPWKRARWRLSCAATPVARTRARRGARTHRGPRGRRPRAGGSLCRGPESGRAGLVCHYRCRHRCRCRCRRAPVGRSERMPDDATCACPRPLRPLRVRRRRRRSRRGVDPARPPRRWRVRASRRRGPPPGAWHRGQRRRHPPHQLQRVSLGTR
mmetsp:Transcript_3719/g.15487  ORF Transcript_3719/g.15487 Transcript_3719/m.15487 type:complete len:221 (-) Transcript_3719:124-786(-)